MSALENTTQNLSIEEVARRLARENAQSEESIREIYLFPHPAEIRLVEVDEITISSDAIRPFHFGSAPEYGIPFPSAIALIRPEEKLRLPPPEGWGTWEKAQKIWPEA
jgi:hypothetical protein